MLPVGGRFSQIQLHAAEEGLVVLQVGRPYAS